VSENGTITEITHALLAQSLTVLRDKETGTATFRHHAGIVSSIVLTEATRTLAVESQPVTTPLAATTGFKIRDKLVIVPVLRAGLAMLNAAHELLGDTPVGFLGLERDEETAVAREYYQKFPAGLSGKRVLVLDPMLATGGSLVDSVQALKARGATDITLVCIVAAPEGLARISKEFPDINIFTAAIDDHLDERKYIVPGLGDFGDRYFGT
jgi:uracil phosphoribosyltransferase